MNSNVPRPPSDSELDRLLGSRLRRTSPDFEQRWRELRPELAGTRPPVRARWPRWFLWPGLTTLIVASFAVLLVVRNAPVPSSDPGLVTFEDLLSLDAALQPARFLLVEENRDALLHLPAQLGAASSSSLPSSP